MKSHRPSERVPACACPHCGHELDAAFSTTGLRPRPKPGDVSVCIECAEVLIYGERLELLQPDPMDLLRLELSPVWESVVKAQAAVRLAHAQTRGKRCPSPGGSRP